MNQFHVVCFDESEIATVSLPSDLVTCLQARRTVGRLGIKAEVWPSTRSLRRLREELLQKLHAAHELRQRTETEPVASAGDDEVVELTAAGWSLAQEVAADEIADELERHKEDPAA